MTYLKESTTANVNQENLQAIANKNVPILPPIMYASVSVYCKLQDTTVCDTYVDTTPNYGYRLVWAQAQATR
jgi:hypothetical protein